MNVKVGIERISTDVSLPTSKFHDNAGWDVYALEDIVLPAMQTDYEEVEIIHIEHDLGSDEAEVIHHTGTIPVKVPLNMKVAIPDGYFMRVVGRSGLSNEGILVAPGTVDAGYRGQVFATMYNLTNKSYQVKKGERIAQVIVMPYAKVDWVERLIDENETERGTTGFGASGAF